MFKSFSNMFLGMGETVCNYGLFWEKRIVEKLFNTMDKQFRCILTMLDGKPEQAIVISKACLILHNLLKDYYGNAPHKLAVVVEWLACLPLTQKIGVCFYLERESSATSG